ncbi:MAG: hypothetical protein HYZ72_00070 [Deltaproteobacteria bacterium]|nr:hypothetical protein [Deltaproteobacteria bacterium]
MVEQLTAEHLVERSPGETLAFDTPRVQVNPGPSASYFVFQRRLRLLAKVSAASLRTLEAENVNLQGRVLAIDEGEVTVVVLLLRIGETTLATYLDVYGPGTPGPAAALRFALEGSTILVRLCSLESGAWETRIRAIPVTGPLREELERVDEYAQKAAHSRPWSPAAFARAQSALAGRLSAHALWQYPS